MVSFTTPAVYTLFGQTKYFASGKIFWYAVPKVACWRHRALGTLHNLAQKGIDYGVLVRKQKTYACNEIQ